MPIIRVELSDAGLDAAIEQLKEYQRKVEALGTNVVKRLTSEGEEIAQMMAPMWTGALMSGIKGEAQGEKGSIQANSDHAAFVEFGTGVVGQASPYPGPLPAGYAYMGGQHHVTTKDGRDGWFFPLDDGSWRFTQGQPSRPFMYNTAQMLAQVVPDVAAEEMQS